MSFSFGSTSFQNLDFEAANLQALPNGQYAFVPADKAFPGWTASIGGVVVTQALQNNFTLGAASIDILGPGSQSSFIIEGRYTAGLQAGYTPGMPFYGASLTQTGQVPLASKAIVLKAAAAANFEVTLNDQSIALVRCGSGPFYGIYNGDVSRFAGQEVKLTLTARPFGGAATPNRVDSIAFTADAVISSTLNLVDPGTNALILSWPATPSRVVLQSRADLLTASWQTVTNLDGAGFSAETAVLVPKPATTTFYRLIWQ